MTDVTHYLPDNHPEAACAYERAAGRVRLNNGQTVPVTGYADEHGDEVLAADLDRHERLVVYYGPLPSGDLGFIQLKRAWRH